MIRNIQSAQPGAGFQHFPDSRRRARRMRAMAIMVTVAIGFSGGLLQQFHQQANLDARLGQAEAPIPTGPLAYFPR